MFPLWVEMKYVICDSFAFPTVIAFMITFVMRVSSYICAVFLNFTCNRSHVCFWLAGQVVSSKQFASLGTIEDYNSGKIDQAESMGVHHKHRQLL